MIYGKIINALPVLRKLAGQELTVKTAYRLNRALQELEQVTRFFEERRMYLAQKYGTDEGGGKWRIRKDNAEAFSHEMEELLNLETEMDYQTVMIPTTENLSLSCNDLRTLEGIVELEWVDT